MMFFNPFATNKGDAQKIIRGQVSIMILHGISPPPHLINQKIGTNLFYEHKIIIKHSVIKILARLLTSSYPFISTNPSHHHIFCIKSKYLGN